MWKTNEQGIFFRNVTQGIVLIGNIKKSIFWEFFLGVNF
jgi:hypothetical protein